MLSFNECYFPSPHDRPWSAQRNDRKIIVSLKRTNLFYIHVIQSYLYLDVLGAFTQLRKSAIFFVKSARLSFRPCGKTRYSLHGGGGSDYWYLSRKFEFVYNLTKIAGTLH